MKRILTIDIGNSNIVTGCFSEAQDLHYASGDYEDSENRRQVFRLETRKKWTTEALQSQLSDFLQANDDTPDSVSGGILSSVVPELNPLIIQAVKNLTGVTLLVMSQELDTGIRPGSYDLSLIGMDRIVDMAAAAEIYGVPAAVWDLGTASTLSVVDPFHVFRGGMIAPGVQLGLNALGSETSQLPTLKASAPEKLLGQDTADNMMSGTVAGTGILISGSSMLLKKEPGLGTLRAVLTGGFGNLVLPWVDPDLDAIYDPDLMMKGLQIIYRRNH